MESIARQLAEGFASKPGIFVDVLVCSPRHEKGDIRELNKVKIHQASSFAYVLGMPLSLAFFHKFRRLCKNSDIVFLHHPFPLGFAAAYLFCGSKPIVVWYHADITRQKLSKLLFLPIIHNILKKAKVIFVSHESLATHSLILRLYKDKCQAIAFGINPKDFEVNEKILSEAESIRNGFPTPILISVGRLVYYKGYEYLIEAMRNVSAHLLIIGKGRLKSKLLRLAEQLGVSGKLTFIDSAEKLQPYFYASDIFILPSTSSAEAFGVVQLEAMACGLPVINTNLPTAVPYVSKHLETGITVEPHNSGELASAINRLLSKNYLRLEMGKRAKERVNSFFSDQQMIDKTFQTLNSIHASSH